VSGPTSTTSPSDAGPADYVGAIGNVSFENGGHLLLWSAASITLLREYRNLLLCSLADTKAGLAHQKWRVLSGELPPRVRMMRVAVPYRMGILAVDAALAGVQLFRASFVKYYIEADDLADEVDEEVSA
jgi:hypothetical protein